VTAEIRSSQLRSFMVAPPKEYASYGVLQIG